ncbi:hypothetical protein K505DRAFT_374404 [Melanomma pulvis-pyrius CBS 109.77]|uniref:Uncharacterized protein n=1 Tax=Melanomma pulvis-pyrius CBS 109.77 TaxID=1314802 RepID=A0A6A6XE89_9PLEO|nr:hypothetical protein K505DRAFT_374404 [Melanomma pulvis-pyrius CBS 109.77]
MNFLNNPAEADPDVNLGSQTARDLHEKASSPKPAYNEAKDEKSIEAASASAANSKYTRDEFLQSEVQAQSPSGFRRNSTGPMVIDEITDDQDHDNTAASLPVTATASFEITTSQPRSHNSKKRAGEEELQSTNHAKAKTEHSVYDTEGKSYISKGSSNGNVTNKFQDTAPNARSKNIGMAATSKPSIAPWNKPYEESKEGIPNRPRKRAGQGRLFRSSSSTASAGAEQPSVVASVKTPTETPKNEEPSTQNELEYGINPIGETNTDTPDDDMANGMANGMTASAEIHTDIHMDSRSVSHREISSRATASHWRRFGIASGATYVRSRLSQVVVFNSQSDDDDDDDDDDSK